MFALVNEDAKAARSAARAAWVAAILSFAAAGGGFGYQVWKDWSSHKEALAVFAVRLRRDYPTELKEFTRFRSTSVNTVAVYFKVIVANHSERPISLIAYGLNCASCGDATKYDTMDQGLWRESPEGQFVPAGAPIIVPERQSIPLLVRVGVRLGTNAFEVIRDEYGETTNRVASIAEVENTDRKGGYDLLGNKLDRRRFLPIDYSDEAFVFTLRTSKGTEASVILEWYGKGRTAAEE